MDCYGRQFDRLEECLNCKERPWCRDAGDPPLIGGDEAGPGGDGAEYERALATVPAEEPEGPQPATGKAADVGAALGELFAGLALACDRDADRIAAVVLRMAGLSYSEVGGLSVRDGGKTKQAVHKDINRMAERCPALGRVLRLRFRQTLDLRSLDRRLADEFRRRVAACPRRRMVIYGELAREFGLGTPQAVRRRLQRLPKTVDVGQSSEAPEPPPVDGAPKA